MGAVAKTSTTIFFEKALINTFADSVVKTLGEMAQTFVTPGKPLIKTQAPIQGDVIGIITMMDGDTRGTLHLGFSGPSAFKIIENMIGENHQTINSEVADAVGELTNMIYGSAKTTLNNLGYHFEMAIPKVTIPTPHLTEQHQGVTLTLPFSIEPNLLFYLEITVQL